MKDEKVENLPFKQVEDIYLNYRESHNHPGAFACCSAHQVADQVPLLLAEIRRPRSTEPQRGRENLRAHIADAARSIPLAVDPDILAAAHQGRPATFGDEDAEMIADTVISALFMVDWRAILSGTEETFHDDPFGALASSCVRGEG